MWILVLPPLLALMAAAAVLFLLRRRYRTSVALLLLGIIVNHASQTIALHPFAPSLEDRKQESSYLRILEYNVWGMSPYLKAHDREPAVGLVSVIDSLHPDLVVLPEYNSVFSHSLGDTLQTHYPWNTKSLMGSPDRGEVQVYSRYPVSNLRRFWLPNDSIYTDPVDETYWTRVWWMDLDVEGRTVKFVYVHLKSNEYTRARRKSAHWIDGVRDYWEGLSVGYGERIKQAVAIRDSLLRWGGPSIVAGDFNDLSGSDVLRTIQDAGLSDAWWKSGFGYGFTYDSYHLYLRLDHVLFSDHFRVVGSKVISGCDFSDHNPLLVDLRFSDK